MRPAPIALFTYNRLIHTKKTIEALRNNELAAESELYIFSDGPRTKLDVYHITAIRDYLAFTKGFLKVHLVAQTENLGLARSIIMGVTKMVNEFGKVIVLEDDMVTSRYFLRYMNEALCAYQNIPNVASIHGYVYPVKEKLPETFFVRGADCWGWATWKRAWDHFEPDGVNLLSLIRSRNLTAEFDYFGAAGYSRMLKNQIKGRNDSWAVRWHASAYILNMLTLYPRLSLVRNIGNDSSGEHCATTDSYEVGDVSETSILVQPVQALENYQAKKAFADFFRRAKRRNRIVRFRSIILGQSQLMLKFKRQFLRFSARIRLSKIFLYYNFLICFSVSLI